MLYGCVVCRNRDEYDVRTAQGFVIDGTNTATLVVKDTEVGELPKAGSTGIFPYIGVATALMSGAMVMTVVTTKRRKALA